MYAVFLNDFRESGVLRKFFGAFAENFKQATVIWLIFMALAAVLAANWYYLLTYSFGGNGLLLAVAAVVSVLYLSVVSFAFALQAKFENPPLQTMKNALILSIGKLFSGVLMSFVNLFPVIMFVVDLDVFVNVVAIWIPLGFALQIQINALSSEGSSESFNPRTRKINKYVLPRNDKENRLYENLCRRICAGTFLLWQVYEFSCFVNGVFKKHNFGIAKENRPMI